MKKVLLFIVVLALVLVATGYWYLSRRPQPQPPTTHPISESRYEPEISHPIEEAAGKEAKAEAGKEKPLPALGQSDQSMKEALSGLFGRRFDRFFILDNFIRRFVVTVDNLPRRDLPLNRLPNRPVPGKFEATGEDGEMTIAPANQRRYTPYIELAEAVEPARAVAVYTRFYPLFQEAYRELGYPHGYFNDRMVEVIDHLLDAPEVSPPIRLVQPKIAYRYADPKLEALSAGQKIMVRMGPENETRAKAVLHRYRQELTAALKK